MSATGAGALAGLKPGFGDPVHDEQRCFRAILDAMAHPGRVVELPDLAANMAPLGSAAASIALSLCDLDTPVWFDDAARDAAGHIAFHCGSPPAQTPAEARFAFAAEAQRLPRLDAFALGSDEYPERSATLVVEVADLVEGSGMRFSGPGIRSEARLGVAGLPARFWAERMVLAELFPRGLDVLFTCGNRLAALPRSTRIALREAG